MVTARVGPVAPLAWDLMIAFLAARAIVGVEEVRDGVYRRTAVVAGRAGSVELSREASSDVVVRASAAGAAGAAVVHARATAIVGGGDGSEADDHLSRDPLLAPLMAACPGLRLPGAWDPFELGVRAIAGQQVSVAGAGTLTGRLARRFGTEVNGAGGSLTHAFPTAARLADADLAGLGFTAARAGAISAFAGAVAVGHLDLDASDPERLVGAIVALPGLGPWTAEYIAARLGAPDAFPASDLGLRRALARLLAVDQVTTPELVARAERWRPYRATAAAHLWMAPPRLWETTADRPPGVWPGRRGGIDRVGRKERGT